MKIAITKWGLNSYLNLKKNNIFSKADYQQKLRPDILLLASYPSNPNFNNSQFWGNAKLAGNNIKYGYKMKWHNLGNGRVQLRLPVAIISEALLCWCYVKNAKSEKRFLTRFDLHINLINKNQHVIMGYLK